MPPEVDMEMPPVEPPPVAEPAAPAPTAPTEANHQPGAPPAEPEQAKTVPLSAVLEERGKRQKLESDNAQLREALETFRGIGERLKADPALLAKVLGPTEQPQTAQMPDAEAREVAVELALYTPQGQPDLEAARRVSARITGIAESIAKKAIDEKVTPIQKEAERTKATGRHAEALETTKALGIDESLARPVFDSIVESSPATFSNPDAAATAVLIAAGRQYLANLQKAGKLPAHMASAAPSPQPAAPAAPEPQAPTPTFTEGQGARPAAMPLSEGEARVARVVGVKADAWQRATAAVQKMTSTGRSVPLED